MDLVTNEPTDGDWRFEVWADVILDDFASAGEKKEAPPPPKGGKGAPPAPGKGGKAAPPPPKPGTKPKGQP